jgi:hypothetical protein
VSDTGPFILGLRQWSGPIGARSLDDAERHLREVLAFFGL